MQYPLERNWTIWCSQYFVHKKGELAVLSDNKQLGEIDNIATMWQYMNNIPQPSKFADGNILIFQSQTMPTWEDNGGGGRWMYSYELKPSEVINELWESLFLSILGENIENSEDIVGIIMGRRKKYTRYSIWTKDVNDDETNLKIGANFVKIIKQHISGEIKLEYQEHGADYKNIKHVINV